MRIARLMRFYHLSLDEVMGLDCEAESMLWQAATPLEAQELLAAIKVTSYPHIKKSQQENLHQKLHRAAFDSVYDKRNKLDPSEIERLING